MFIKVLLCFFCSVYIMLEKEKKVFQVDFRTIFRFHDSVAHPTLPPIKQCSCILFIIIFVVKYLSTFYLINWFSIFKKSFFCPRKFKMSGERLTCLFNFFNLPGFSKMPFSFSQFCLAKPKWCLCISIIKIQNKTAPPRL